MALDGASRSIIIAHLESIDDLSLCLAIRDGVEVGLVGQSLQATVVTVIFVYSYIDGAVSSKVFVVVNNVRTLLVGGDDGSGNVDNGGLSSIVTILCYYTVEGDGIETSGVAVDGCVV